MNRWLRIVLVLLTVPVTLELSGCAVVAGAGVATGAVAGYDRRTTGTFIDDGIIEHKVMERIRQESDLWEQSHINATSFNNIVLLTGETPSDSAKTRIGQLTATIEKVRRVHNEVVLAAPSSMLARSSDSWITGKVKTKLLTEMALDAARVKVVTEQGVVYLMGLVTNDEADRATDFARRTSGVQRVVRLFEIVQG